MKKLIDLHIHSSHSDGVHPPAELVRMAAERGLATIAVADHDAVEGIDEAVAAGEQWGVEVVPALELSVEHGRYRDVHILGYWIDHRDEALRERLAEFRRIRDDRGRAIVDRINRKLVASRKHPLSYEQVRSLADGAVGRPHIARVLMNAGYARDMGDAFKRYLIPFNVPKNYIPAAVAIAEIRRIGGVAVLAHPTTVSDNRRELRRIIEELVQLGLDGIEVFNNMCFKDDMIFLEGLADEFDLIITGGSDYHGIEDDVEIGIGRGGLAVSHHLAVELRKRAESRAATPHAPNR
ncbi:PHP domain-containing protein [Geobacter pickeringii]|uniref:Phosphoesterase n=1 Tax=Geobacter pickeringii TaxID=345632 RepID=A0A0B5B9R4_9BACT|nr:PHP domain-containing protein [Geobacter pickeringii]AJE03453.1 phosphoesterase [Geobacter pickeringii]